MMDPKLETILESLLSNIDVLNIEIDRMGRSGQFSPNKHALQLIERIRDSCTASLQNLRTVERGIYRYQAANESPPADLLPFPK